MGLGGAQIDFEFAKASFNGLKIGRIGRLIQQVGPTGFVELGQPSYSVGGQAVEHDHVVGAPGRGQYRHQRHVGSVVYGRIACPRPGCSGGNMSG